MRGNGSSIGAVEVCDARDDEGSDALGNKMEREGGFIYRKLTSALVNAAKQLIKLKASFSLPLRKFLVKYGFASGHSGLTQRRKIYLI